MHCSPDYEGEPIGPDCGLTTMAEYINNRASTIYGGSAEIQRDIIAKRVLLARKDRQSQVGKYIACLLNTAKNRICCATVQSKYLRENYSFENRQAAVKRARGFDAEQWQMFAELGWLAMTFEEEADGFGGGALETMILCEQFGKYLVLEPYLESVVLVGGLIEAGAQPAIKESVSLRPDGR